MKQEQAKELTTNERVAASVKVAGSKVLLEVLRKKDSGLILIADQQKAFESFFPIIIKGEQVHSFEVGDYVAVKPGVDFPLIFLYGKEYMLCNLFEIEYGVTNSYAAVHEQYEKEREASKATTGKLLSDAKKGAEMFSKEVIPNKAPIIIDKTKYK